MLVPVLVQTACLLGGLPPGGRADGLETGAHVTATTPFEADHQGGIVIPVMLDGRGPFRMLLDTGSTHSAVTDEIVDALDAPLVAKTTVSTTSGSTEQAVARIGRVRLGPVEVEHVLATVVNTSRVGDGRILHGVIGQDVLAGRHYTIDFPGRRITWHGEPSQRAPDAGLALTPAGGRFVVDLPQRHGLLRLVPDTGAGDVVLFAGGPLRVSSLGEKGVELATLNGVTRVRRVQIGELRIDGHTWRDVPAVWVPRHDAAASGVHGLLPLHTFRRVTFDGPRRRLYLE